MKTAFLLLTSSLVIAASGAFAQGNTRRLPQPIRLMHGTLLHAAAVDAGILLELVRGEHQPVLRRHVRQTSRARRPSSRRPNRLSAEAAEARDEAKTGPRPRQSRKRKRSNVSSRRRRSRRGAGGAFVALSQAVRGCAQAHPQDDGPSSSALLLAGRRRRGGADVPPRVGRCLLVGDLFVDGPIVLRLDFAIPLKFLRRPATFARASCVMGIGLPVLPLLPPAGRRHLRSAGSGWPRLG